MHWARALDVTLFHWVNPALSNPLFDVIMPFVSGNQLFAPVLIVTILMTAWKGGARGRICVVMLLLAIALGDSVVCHTLKQLLQRPRPFLTLADVHVPAGVGRTSSGSMPSSHAANWFAAAMVLRIYYRRSLWFMLPAALLVSFSRVYNGVHYPGDVLAGAVLGAGYAAAGVWALDAIWKTAGRRWFPTWWERLPSLMHPQPRPASGNSAETLIERQWMRLGYLLIAAQLAAGLLYLASGATDLTGDEAYQWLWSKHLALSYYSKPPLIAWMQFAGTHLWGDTVIGVRFFSPVIAAIIGCCLLRFMAGVVGVRPAFWLSVAIPLAPLFAVGSVLMTVDPPSVLFWTLAMILGWRALQENAGRAPWLWVGLWMGLGFLSKYTALIQLVSWMLFFLLWAPARRQLRHSGPWLALGITAVCTIPVLIWNAQHGWITLHHVSEGGHFDQTWAFTAANLWYGLKNYTAEFLGLQAALQNPFFFLPAVWAAFAFWKKRESFPLSLYFFCMGAPEFLGYFLLTFHSRVLPNWVVPSIIPFFCLATFYWRLRWDAGARSVRYWLACGITAGVIVVVVLHDPELITRIAGRPLPAAWNPLRRTQRWQETANLVEAARQQLMKEGKPVFIVTGHYSLTGEITFHLPEARAGLPDHPLVYFRHSSVPENQFYFWPGYENRLTQNAIYVQELDFANPRPEPPTVEVSGQFESIRDLGVFEVLDDNQPIRHIQMFECRNLLPATK